jgi:hypothetical protein
MAHFPFRDPNGNFRKNNPKNPPIRPVDRSPFPGKGVQFDLGLIILRYMGRYCQYTSIDKILKIKVRIPGFGSFKRGVNSFFNWVDDRCIGFF